MKKNYLFLALFLTLAATFTSCLRDGDMEMLRHPIHIRGEIDPNFGVPLAYGEADINDLLGMLNGEYNGYLDPNAEILTLVFDTVASDTIYGHGGSSAMPSPVSTKGSGWFHKDTIITYTVPIGLFNNIDPNGEFANDNIQIGDFWLNIGADVKATPKPNVDSALTEGWVAATIRDLNVFYTDHNGISKQFNELGEIDSIDIQNLVAGIHHDYDSINLRNIINDMPLDVSVQFRLRLKVSSSVFSGNISTTDFGALLDSARLTNLGYNVDLSLALPFEVKIGQLAYVDTLDLGEGLSSINLDSILASIDSGITPDLKDSRFTLSMGNGLPVNLSLSARTLADDGTTCEIIPDTTIHSADTRPVVGTVGVEESSNMVTTPISVLLNREKLDRISEAKKIIISIGVGTNNKVVAIKKTDKLHIKAFLQIHPSITIDIPVTDEGLLK